MNILPYIHIKFLCKLLNLEITQVKKVGKKKDSTKVLPKIQEKKLKPRKDGVPEAKRKVHISRNIYYTCRLQLCQPLQCAHAICLLLIINLF